MPNQYRPDEKSGKEIGVYCGNITVKFKFDKREYAYIHTYTHTYSLVC